MNGNAVVLTCPFEISLPTPENQSLQKSSGASPSRTQHVRVSQLSSLLDAKKRSRDPATYTISRMMVAGSIPLHTSLLEAQHRRQPGHHVGRPLRGQMSMIP
jgi:hypothetical protein